MRTIARLCALMALVLVGGCGGSGTSSPHRRHVTLMLDWTPNTNHAGIYVAKAKGMYAKVGLDVDIVEPDQAGALAQVASGNADFGVSAAESVLSARAQGTHVRSIAAVMRTNTSSLITPADRGIARPRDLAGHTYGGYGADLERALVESLVRCDGGDPRSVHYAQIGNVDYAIGFRKHQYDAVWVFDGWDTIRMRDLLHMQVRTIPFRHERRCIPDWYTPVIVASDTTIARDPALVRDFLAATAQGYLDVARSPVEDANLITRRMPEADPVLWRASARFIAPFLTDSRGGWGYQQPAVWARFNAFLRAHRLETIPDVRAAYTNAFLPAGS